MRACTSKSKSGSSKRVGKSVKLQEKKILKIEKVLMILVNIDSKVSTSK